jgi:hypothetical protein
MSDLRIRGDRIWSVSSNGAGVFIPKAELALADGVAITIAGTDENGEIRTLSFAGDELLTKASQNGDWKVQQAGEWNVAVHGPVRFDWSAPGYSNFVAPIFGQAGIDGGAGATTDKTVRVTLASDTAALSVSGTVAATQSGVWSVGVSGTVTVSGPLTDTQLRASAVPVSLATLPNPSNLDVALSTRLKPADTLAGVTLVTTVGTITNVVHVDDNGSTLSIDDGGGSITVDGSVSVTGSTVAIGASVLPSGAATDTLQATGNATLTSILADLTALLIAQGATQTSQVGPMVQAAVSDTPESYSPNTVQPLSITNDGLCLTFKFAARSWAVPVRRSRSPPTSLARSASRTRTRATSRRCAPATSTGFRRATSRSPRVRATPRRPTRPSTSCSGTRSPAARCWC